jgi:tetratricopeptide (TPR) repeat protein
MVAIGFSILLNLALVTSFIWPWSLGDTFPLIAWPIIFLVWSTSAMLTYRNLPDLMSAEKKLPQNQTIQCDTLFIQAQREYLGGHWEEAEILLRRCLDISDRDIEARLLMATILRHSRQLDKATIELDQILKYDEANSWLFEIQREQRLIELIVEHEQAMAVKPDRSH